MQFLPSPQKIGSGKMNLCSSEHEEICYEGKYCPVCEKMAEISKLKNEISHLQDNLSDLESEMSRLEDGRDI